MKIKNKICLTYDGHNPEYLIQLRMLEPALMKTFPEIEFNFACRKEYGKYLNSFIPIEIYNETKNDFAFRYEIIYDATIKKHPIIEIINNSNLEVKKTSVLPPRGRTAYISTNGDFPNLNLNEEQIKKAKIFARNKGLDNSIIDRKFSAEETKKIASNAAYVIGTSNELFYEAVAIGIPTVLIPTNGSSEEIYKMLVESPNVIP